MTLKILVKLKRKESLTWDGQRLVASISASPIKGAANRKLESALARWLGIAPSLVTVQKGQASRHKSVELDCEHEIIQKAIDALPEFPKELRLK